MQNALVFSRNSRVIRPPLTRSFSKPKSIWQESAKRALSAISGIGKVMLKVLEFMGFVGLIILLHLGAAFALDVPHAAPESVGCSNCHTLHNSLGSNLTNQPTNEALCKSCHTFTGTASSLPFANSDQAKPGISGTSHSWSGLMPAVSNPLNAYGLRATADLTNSAVKARVSGSGNAIICSACHDEHSQLKLPWDALAIPASRGQAGTATGGSVNTLVDTSKTWTVNQWANATVKIMSGADSGLVRKVISNTENQLTFGSPFPNAIAATTSYYINSNRHFMRVTNTANQLCLDCHYYRNQSDVTTYTGTPLSHPINKALAAAKDPTQFFSIPLEPESAGFVPQTGTRGELNGGTDTNLKNNIVVASDLGILCLSCHDMHYTGSNDGYILRRSLEETCHACHKTDRNAPFDANSIKTHNSTNIGSTKWGVSGWGITGGKYGAFGCTTCHTAHSTPNIYVIKNSIPTPDGSNWESTGIASISFVEFKKKALDGSPDPGVADGVMGDDTGGHTTSSKVCEGCHSQTKYHRFNASGQTDLSHYNSQDCTRCHSHKNGFRHGGGGSGGGCQNCHGHEDDWPVVPGNTWSGTKQSHATHTENDGDDIRGPNPSMTCADCHDTTAFPKFKDGQDLAGTTVCDNCHSPGGAFNGVNSTSGSIGAKDNWKAGVYTGNSLQAGKEKWCVGCHDAGTSVIGGRQAPDIAGNGSTYGYYAGGHGSKSTECGGCHGLDMNHNFDGKKTYLGTSKNYVSGFRLKDNLSVPLTVTACGFNSNNFKLCLNCHNETALLSDTKDHGCYDCLTNPYRTAPAILTSFRNTHPQGHNTGGNDIPANFHADHLLDVNSFGVSWYSDGPGTGTGSSATTCTTCHNPHGDKLTTNNATPKMTRGLFDVSHGSDSYGDYGMVSGTGYYTNGNPQRVCGFACHGSPAKWYINAAPSIMAISVADNNSSDPSPADYGYTNSRNIQVTLTVAGSPAPAEMMLAEDAGFSNNSTGWITFASPYTYTLTATEGSKRVYAKARNAIGTSPSVSSISIVLDMTPPTVGPNALISPNGGEIWDQNTSRPVTWSGISDTNLKTSPITLKYSTDDGSSYPNTIVSNIGNSGTYTWNPLPMVHSSLMRVQLIATDRAGNQASDTSNSNFTIHALTPVLNGFTLSDNNSSDPSAAEPGYTNSRSINLTITTNNYPTEMMLAEDSGFTQNSTGWITYSASSTYTLTDGDGAKTVYLKVRNVAGESGTGSSVITLDRTVPTITVGSLTAPNGGETWAENSVQNIMWNSGQISDVNLAAAPINIYVSRDSGSTWTTLWTGIGNSGSVGWTVPKPATLYGRMKIEAQDKAGNRSSIVSDADFRISTPYVVTSTNDSGAGSLRQVITDLVAAGGNDEIWFDIPDGSLTNGVGVIGLNTALPTITAAGITINGTSQAILHPANKNSRGPSIRLHGNIYSFNGLNVSGSNTTVRGMQFTNFYNYGINITGGSNSVAEGNHIGFRSDSATTYTGLGNQYGIGISGGSGHRIGGASSEAANYICGIVRTSIYANAGCSIINNSFGLLPDGTALTNGSTWTSLDLSGSNITVQGNRISGSNSSNTAAIRVTGSNTTIKGNIFGLYYNGSTWSARSVPYYAIMVNSTSASNIVIGGSNVASSDSVLNDSNVIASAQFAVYVNQHNNANPTSIWGNFIGTNPERTQTFQGSTGVYLSGSNARAARVGGYAAGQAGNVIANMTAKGVHVAAGSAFTDVRNNSFFSNGTSAALSDDAIYLAATANDWPTTGTSITRPTIASASTASVTVDGVLSGEVVDVYVSDYDGSGTEYGEGKTFIGTATASGTTVTVPVSGVIVGQWVTATRTSFSGTTGNTSGFSPNVQVQ